MTNANANTTWITVDQHRDGNGDTFIAEHVTKEAAIAAAKYDWQCLTPVEQKAREIWIGYNVDESTDEKVWSCDEIDNPLVITSYGEWYPMEIVAAYMNDEIREELHDKLAPCKNQAFYEAYCEEHLQKFEEDFLFEREIVQY